MKHSIQVLLPFLVVIAGIQADRGLAAPKKVDQCSQIRAIRTLANQEGLDEVTLSLLQDRYCGMQPGPRNSASGSPETPASNATATPAATPQPPQPTAQPPAPENPVAADPVAQQDCNDLTIMVQLSRIAGNSASNRLVEDKQKASCQPTSTAKSPTSGAWASGLDAKSGNSWYYPNGSYARSGLNWYYPNGTYARMGSSLYYPNGSQAKLGENWLLPNGATVSRENLLTWACGVVGKQRCEAQNATASGDEFAQELATLAIAWAAYQSNRR